MPYRFYFVCLCRALSIDCLCWPSGSWVVLSVRGVGMEEHTCALPPCVWSIMMDFHISSNGWERSYRNWGREGIFFDANITPRTFSTIIFVCKREGILCITPLLPNGKWSTGDVSLDQGYHARLWGWWCVIHVFLLVWLFISALFHDKILKRKG